MLKKNDNQWSIEINKYLLVTKKLNLMKFKQIYFSDEELKIKDIKGVVHSYNLIDEALYLNVTKTTARDSEWEVFATRPNVTEKPNYKCIVPFGKSGDMADLEFGRINSFATLLLQKEQNANPGEDDPVIIAEEKNFFMIAKDTIGTGDLRNGKVNVNAFSMENKKLFLKIIPFGQTNADYDLVIGYEK